MRTSLGVERVRGWFFEVTRYLIEEDTAPTYMQFLEYFNDEKEKEEINCSLNPPGHQLTV